MLPHRPGLATGFSMAVFGLSPLFLSTLSSTFFTDPATGLLQAVPFLTTLAIAAIATHVLGMFAYHALAPGTTTPPPDQERIDSIDEHTALLPCKRPDGRLSALPDCLRDRYFWVLALYCLLVIGAVSIHPAFTPNPLFISLFRSPKWSSQIWGQFLCHFHLGLLFTPDI